MSKSKLLLHYMESLDERIKLNQIFRRHKQKYDDFNITYTPSEGKDKYDYIIYNGDNPVIIGEMKKRNVASWRYNDQGMLLEYNKWSALKQLADKWNIPHIHYVNTFTDNSYIIFNISNMSEDDFEIDHRGFARNTTLGSAKISKKVAYLKYQLADTMHVDKWKGVDDIKFSKLAERVKKDINVDIRKDNFDLFLKYPKIGQNYQNVYQKKPII